MMKKTEVLEALENGCMISVDSIYRTARVLDADYNEIDTCRYDTAERIERSEGYKRRKTSWFAHWYIEKDWDAVSARVMAAVTDTFRAMERAGVISDLEVEPMTAAQVAKASAALDAAEEASQEAAPAQEAPAQPAPKQYAKADGTEGTRSASEALSWHRAGHDVIVAAPGKTAVYVRGAAQETERRKDENRAHCKHIADELDAYINGEVKRCPDCGEIHRRDWDDVGDCFRCPNCGSVRDLFDWEDLGIWDFLSDVYDVEFRCGSDRELRSVCVMVACGGPNIYLDSASKNVELYWWSERAWYPMSYEAAAELEAWAEEYWNCL